MSHSTVQMETLPTANVDPLVLVFIEGEVRDRMRERLWTGVSEFLPAEHALRIAVRMGTFAVR